MASTDHGTYLRLTGGGWRRLTSDAGRPIILRGSHAVLDAFVGPFFKNGSSLGENAFAIDTITLPSGPVRRVAVSFLPASTQCSCATISHVASPALAGGYVYWLETSVVVKPYDFVYPPPPPFAVYRLKIGAPTTTVSWWQAPQPIAWITIASRQLYAVAGTYLSTAPGIFSYTPSWTSATRPMPPKSGTPCSRT